MVEESKEKSSSTNTTEKIQDAAIAEANDEDLGQQAKSNFGPMIFYACIVFIGILVIAFLASGAGQAISDFLGPIIGAATEILETTGRHPWLLVQENH